MIRVKQRKKDDCLTAAVASLFEINYEEVPFFAKPSRERQWVSRLREWVGKKGYDAELKWTFKISDLQGNKVIGVGPSPSSAGNFHAVLIDENLKVIFDPGYRLRKTVKEIEYVIIFRRKDGQG